MSGMLKIIGLASVLFALHSVASAQGTRDHLTIVGSSTLFPMITTAAEGYSRFSSRPSPIVESTGTGGGFKLFCNGYRSEFPDINMASRPMKASEWKRCEENGVTSIKVLKLGFGGIALGNSKQGPSFSLRARDLYLALAREVPAPDGVSELVINPFESWQEVNPDLPDVKIRVYGPPPTSGTRDLLVERLFKPICLQYDFFRAMRSDDEATFRQRCYALREDLAYIPAGENDARLVRRLIDDPGALGILGFNLLERHQDRMQPVVVDGIRPNHDTITDGTYLLTRPLFLFAKWTGLQRARGIEEFLAYLSKDSVSGQEGYLLDSGLIAMDGSEREKWKQGLDQSRGCRLNQCPCESAEGQVCCEGCR